MKITLIFQLNSIKNTRQLIKFIGSGLFFVKPSKMLMTSVRLLVRLSALKGSPSHNNVSELVMQCLRVCHCQLHVGLPQQNVAGVGLMMRSQLGKHLFVPTTVHENSLKHMCQLVKRQTGRQANN
ncbi:hypothetical protein HELRODRAFT_163474 [Helobdella robusta]|uniref:Uncharacterized protein n=1 Tax=Helobdella robusta TaxID=6412 RepID=T1EU39_HELRO|nr:hypothetical protein HELRODRAFT_163474 [Helobdella robusta]ESN96413.1 hypothetical protein HELRODRAFT_163474 [Helobdella robusta]